MSIPPTDPIGITEAFRRDLDAIDARLIREAIRIFGAARRRLMEQVDALIAALGDPANPVPGNALALARQAELLQQVDTWLTRAGVQIEPAMMEARRQAVTAALDYAEQVVVSQGASLQQRIELAREWTRLDDDAVKELIDTMSDGTPTRRWLRQFGTETAEAIEEVIEQAVTEKKNVADLARELERETGMAERRAYTVTRESTFGVQRRTTEANYQNNRHLLVGKIRIEKLDEKTCRACMALHGTIYPVDVQMPRHVNCRGIPGPVVRNGIGLQGIPSGEDWLRQQNEQTQRTLLGSEAGYEAWKAGDVSLSDFTEVVDSEWGPQSRVVGVDRARANAQRRRAG